MIWATAEAGVELSIQVFVLRDGQFCPLRGSWLRQFLVVFVTWSFALCRCCRRCEERIAIAELGGLLSQLVVFLAVTKIRTLSTTSMGVRA